MMRKGIFLLAWLAAAAALPPPVSAAESVIQVWGGASGGSSLGRGAIEAGAGAGMGPLFAGFSTGVRDRHSQEDRELQDEYGVDASTSRFHLLGGYRIGRLRKGGAAVWVGGAVGMHRRSECEIQPRDDPFVRLRPAECVTVPEMEYGPAGGAEIGLGKGVALILNTRWTRRSGMAVGIGVGFRFGGGDGF